MSGVPAWAVRGAKVVCVDARGTHTCDVDELAAGQVYTVRWAGSFDHPLQGYFPATVRLEDVVRVGLDDDNLGILDCPFSLDRFRPLVDDQAQERDAAMFRKMLTADQKIPEDAL